MTRCMTPGAMRIVQRCSYQETYLSSIHAAEKPRYNNRNHLDAGAMPAAIQNSTSQILCWHTLLDSALELPKSNCSSDWSVWSASPKVGVLRRLSKSTPYRFTLGLSDGAQERSGDYVRILWKRLSSNSFQCVCVLTRAQDIRIFIMKYLINI